MGQDTTPLRTSKKEVWNDIFTLSVFCKNAKRLYNIRNSIIIISILLTVVVSGCKNRADNEIAQEASINYIKNQMKNPDSFKVLSVETRLDTIPPYISENVFLALDEFQEASKEADNYIPSFSQVSLQKKVDLLKESIKKGKKMQAIVRNSRNKTPNIEYLTCVKYNAANAIGGSLSSYAIVIASKSKPDSIIGSFNFEDDGFIERFMILSKEYHGKERLKKNMYGKIDTIGFSSFEKFIFKAM